ncbi:hypothetical protein LMG28140_01089 [Paraburkholderia metrosideri]|jgi:hypothetical protein|uniref:Uncharacterized protein n=1 Tax=Paraburkholderia metrosideri TaxID=580937 RepID=A0ABM8NDE5_9BURK|nr:hypothetical protein LMG28140_01089 [Paraburkholderia metrosideri]
MCCAIVALTMTLLASWRSVSSTVGARVGWLRRMAIVVIAMATAAGSAIAADQFAAGGRGGSLANITQSGSLPLCGHFFR